MLVLHFDAKGYLAVVALPVAAPAVVLAVPPLPLHVHVPPARTAAAAAAAAAACEDRNTSTAAVLRRPRSVPWQRRRRRPAGPEVSRQRRALHEKDDSARHGAGESKLGRPRRVLQVRRERFEHRQVPLSHLVEVSHDTRVRRCLAYHGLGRQDGFFFFFFFFCISMIGITTDVVAES